MKYSASLGAVAALILAGTGCQNQSVRQKSGTEFKLNTAGKMEAVTYVSPEEYQRMSQAERDRLHAAVGVEAGATVWTNRKP